MTDSGQAQDPQPDGSPSPSTAPPTAEERAAAVIRAIAEGADPGREAFLLSNEFTDSWTARAGAAVRRILRRS